MRVIIKKDYSQTCKWVAEYIVNAIHRKQPTNRKPFVLGLAASPALLGVYEELIALHKDSQVSFANIVTFNMSEYIGIDAEHPLSHHCFMQTNFFQHINIKKANINILNGNAKNLERECFTYEEKLNKFGGADLFIGDIGTDGHIAFNEPGSSLASRTRIKTLTDESIADNAKIFGSEETPRTALTVGVGTIMDSREVLILVSGHEKARALRDAVEGGVNHICTVSCLQLHPHGIIACDDAATEEMKVRTVNYFKSIEKQEI